MRQTGVKDALGSADVGNVPIQTRCPSCGAALPVAAAWCSLCHSDLRPRTVTPSAAVVLPGTPAPQPSGAAAAALPAPGSTLTDEPRPTGRHSAERVVTTPLAEVAHTGVPDRNGRDEAADAAIRGSRSADRGRAASRGRHAAGARSAPVVHDLAHLDPIPLPSSDTVTTEEVEAIADRMLSRLAILEERPRLLDPDDLPGGKWGFIGGGMLAVVVVVLAVGSLIVLITNR